MIPVQFVDGKKFSQSAIIAQVRSRYLPISFSTRQFFLADNQWHPLAWPFSGFLRGQLVNTTFFLGKRKRK